MTFPEFLMRAKGDTRAVYHVRLLNRLIVGRVLFPAAGLVMLLLLLLMMMMMMMIVTRMTTTMTIAPTILSLFRIPLLRALPPPPENWPRYS
jgi:type IV secretory pathway VirB6-like protein